MTAGAGRRTTNNERRGLSPPDKPAASPGSLSRQGEPRMTAVHRNLLGFAFLLCLGGAALGADWPQFLGPNRDGVSAETGLIQSWPKDGPPLLWQQKVGEGFSGPVVAGDRLILFH